MFTGVKTRRDLEAIATATTLPIVLGNPTEDMTDWDFLARQRVRIAVQGHAPIAAATQAVYDTLKAVREGAAPKQLKGVAPADLMNRITRDALVKQRGAAFLGLKR
jgi:carboxyvinyl-carboxyphosphonate phosphorylmutase